MSLKRTISIGTVQLADAPESAKEQEMKKIRSLKLAMKKEKECLESYRQLTLERFLDKLVIHPKKSQLLTFWYVYLSMVSLVQSFIYSFMIAYETEEYQVTLIVLLSLVELTYIVELCVMSLLAYDLSG